MTTLNLSISSSPESAKLSPCDTNAKSSHHKRCLVTRRGTGGGGSKLKGLFMNLSACFIMYRMVSDVLCMQPLKNRYGTVTVISAKPCQNALGQFGTCMFMWDCIKSEGVHLGTCSDRFLFGSCCHHNASLLNPSEQSNPYNQKATNVTTDHSVSGLLQSGSDTSSNVGEESHSRPQSSGDKLLDSTAGSPTEAPPQAPTTVAVADISVVRPTKPDRVFLAGQSTLSSDRLDYVTTSSASNSSGDNHVVSIIQDHLRPSQQQQQQQQQTVIKNHALVEHNELSASSHNESTATVGAHASPGTTTLTALNTSSISEQYQPGPPPPAAPGLVAGQQPVTSLQQSGEANQIMAYQLVSPPSIPISMTSAYTSPPPAPSVSETAQIQTQRPASWLSRPSLLANAIFHSFKPYLSPNRQRPTYRPFIGGGRFRPHQMRPTVLNSPNPQRPHPFFPVNSSANNQQQANTTQVPAIIPNQIAPSGNDSGQASNSTTMQQDNNDHHIVNPSSMTDRRRPVDNGRPSLVISISGDKMQQQQQQQHVDTHHELQGGSQLSGATPSDSMIKVTSEYSPAQDNSSSSLTSTSSGAQVGGYLIGFNNSNKTLVGVQPVSNSPLVPDSIYIYNSSQAHGYSLANNSLAHYQQQQQQHQPLPVGGNSSVLLSYPLSSNQPALLGTSPIPDVMSPIDEIYGLTDGSQQESQPTAGAAVAVGQTTMAVQESTIVSTGGDQQQQQAHDSNNQRPQHQSSLALGTISAGGALLPEVQTGSQSSQPNAANWTTNQPATNPPPLATTPSATTIVPISANPRPVNHHAAHHRVPPLPNGTLREATCGVTGLYPQTKVVGGKNAAFGAWPWQVSVRKVSFFGFSSMHRCGGAVISSEWIATAGHCVQDLALQSIRIRVGEYDFETIAEPYPHLERSARRKIVHPDYNTYTYENDLALIQLDQPLQFSTHVAPICLPPDNIDLVGRNATVTGWGRLNEGGSLPSILQEVIVPIVSNDKCRDMFLRAGRPEYIPDIFLCAGYEEGGRDSCQGDSGGPLQVRGDDGRWMLAGIISWGIGCAEPLLVGVCSAIQRFKPWITATISGG